MCVVTIFYLTHSLTLLVYIAIHIATYVRSCTGIYMFLLNVTGFEKSRLPRTQQQDILFHHQIIAVHIDLLFRQILMLKVALAAFAVASF